MLRLPAVTGRPEGAKVTSGDKEQMSVGVTAVGVNAASTRGMRMLGVIGVDDAISIRHLFKRQRVSRRQIMPIRRKHQVRDGNQHQKQDQGASTHTDQSNC
jgi:hypothetical protein